MNTKRTDGITTTTQWLSTSQPVISLWLLFEMRAFATKAFINSGSNAAALGAVSMHIIKHDRSINFNSRPHLCSFPYCVITIPKIELWLASTRVICCHDRTNQKLKWIGAVIPKFFLGSKSVDSEHLRQKCHAVYAMLMWKEMLLYKSQTYAHFSEAKTRLFPSTINVFSNPVHS